MRSRSYGMVPCCFARFAILRRLHVCMPAHAIIEADREVGKISAGNSGSITVLSGIMNTGEATGSDHT